jgi:hypothetical protein
MEPVEDDSLNTEAKLIQRIVALSAKLSKDGLRDVTHRLVELITQLPQETVSPVLQPQVSQVEPPSIIPGAESSGSESSEGRRTHIIATAKVGGEQPRRKKRRRRKRKNKPNQPNEPAAVKRQTRSHPSGQHNTQHNTHHTHHMQHQQPHQKDPSPRGRDHKPQFTIRYLTGIEPVGDPGPRYKQNLVGGFSTPMTPGDISDFKNEFGSELSHYGSNNDDDNPENEYGDWMTSPNPTPQIDDAEDDIYSSDQVFRGDHLPAHKTNSRTSRNIPPVPDW